MTTENLVIMEQTKLLHAFQNEQKIMQKDLQKMQEHIEKLVGVLIGSVIEYGKSRQLRIPKSTMKRVHKGLRMNIGLDMKTEDIVVSLKDAEPNSPKATTVKDQKLLHIVSPDEMAKNEDNKIPETVVEQTAVAQADKE